MSFLVNEKVGDNLFLCRNAKKQGFVYLFLWYNLKNSNKNLKGMRRNAGSSQYYGFNSKLAKR